MLNLPPPPPPPTSSEQTLLELAAYYHQLLDYYQQASAEVAKQLAHIEALVNPNCLILDKAQDQSNLTRMGEVQQGAVVDKLTLSPSSAFLSSEVARSLPVSQLLKQSAQKSFISQERYSSDPIGDSKETNASHAKSVANERQKIDLYTALARILAANRGTMLHIDYLVREIFGQLSEPEHTTAQEYLEQILQVGEQQQQWFAVPDASGCWTIDLEDFPNLAAKAALSSTNKRAKKHFPHKNKHPKPHPERSRLPKSRRLEQFDSWMDAVGTFIEQSYPQTISSTDVVDWLYPEGLSKIHHKLVRSDANKTLSAGCQRGLWQRKGVGVYLGFGS